MENSHRQRDEQNRPDRICKNHHQCHDKAGEKRRCTGVGSGEDLSDTSLPPRWYCRSFTWRTSGVKRGIRVSTILSKHQMSEEDIKLQYITPAILSKWDRDKITMEICITDGKINLKGNFVSREKLKRADYILLSQRKQSRCHCRSKRQYARHFLWFAAGNDLCANAGCSLCIQLQRGWLRRTRFPDRAEARIRSGRLSHRTGADRPV